MKKPTFAQYVENFSGWKLKEKGSGRVSRDELKVLRESYQKLDEPKQTPRDVLREEVKKYQSWKLKTKGTDKLTEKELNQLKSLTISKLKETKAPESRSIENDYGKLVESYKAFKRQKTPGVKISYKELKMLKEAVAMANKKGIKLREADIGLDPSAAAGGQPPAATGAPTDPMAAAPATNVDPTVVASIQDVKQSVDALAMSVGIQNADLNADPNAAIPPVDGMQQPPAAGGQPMMESIIKNYSEWKLKEKGTSKITKDELEFLKEQYNKSLEPKDELTKIKERIAARNAALRENGAQDLAKKELGAMGLGSELHSNSEPYGGAETNAEQVVVPATGSLANGYSSGKAAAETKPAKTWPTKATKTSDTGGALQGAGATQKKIKESEECTKKECEEEEKDKLKESAKSVTDIYVDEYFAPKLSFEKLKEALNSGFLG